MLLKKNIPMKYVFGKIKWELTAVLVYACAVAVLYRYFHFTGISIPLSVPMILGTVMSLLLAFRSNQAYDRWWEARTIWGAIVNDGRTLGRQILSFVKTEYEPEALKAFREKFLRRQMAWNYALSQRLRDEAATAGLERFISRRELSIISRYNNPTAALLELHARDLAHALEQGWINQYQHVELDRTLSRLCDAMGKCERIKNTVFPVTYSLYIHLAMNFFILMLPFALLEFFSFMEVPIVVVIGGLFLLIEKMAIHLQDPFENKPTDTPMTAISNTIEQDLRQMLNDREEPVAASACVHKGYYQL